MVEQLAYCHGGQERGGEPLRLILTDPVSPHDVRYGYVRDGGREDHGEAASQPEKSQQPPVLWAVTFEQDLGGFWHPD